MNINAPNAKKVFERIVSVADSSKAVFCDCSPKAKAKKIISAPSFRLEGSGWYETDFKTVIKKILYNQRIKLKKQIRKPKNLIIQKLLKKINQSFSI